MSARRSKTRIGSDRTDERKKTRGEANLSEGGARTDQAVSLSLISQIYVPKQRTR